MRKPEDWKDLTRAEKRAWKLERERGLRRWFARAFDIVGPLAETAVETAAGLDGLSGEERHRQARRLVVAGLDAAIVLPEPWETISDIAIRAAVPLISGAIERAYLKRQAGADISGK